MEKKKELKVIESETAKLLELLGVEAKVSVISGEDLVQVNMETSDSALLIGYHGENLSSLQLVLTLICQKKLGYFKRLILDVGDYRKKREETVRQLALSRAELVKTTGNPQILYGLSALERRLVHMAISEDPQLSSQSEGEGRERRLVIKLKE